jgi:Fe-S-cluster containining protein
MSHKAIAREKRRKESKRNGCACPLCKECCEREPGWFMPDEVAIAANFMKLPEGEFIKNYCEEHMEGDVIVISPAKKKKNGSCIFLTKEGLCAIHEVKPHECKKVFACQKEYRQTRMREIIKKSWRK